MAAARVTLDQAVGVAQKEADAPQQQRPDPKLEATRLKAQADIAKTKMGLQAAQAEHGMHLRELAAETEAEVVQQQAQRVNNVAEIEAARSGGRPGGIP
mgnify:CR=1 FL=1